MEFVKSLMDESYTLAWVDYRDSFNDNYALIQKCLNEKSPESLWESIDGWYSDSEWESIKGIIEKLKEECSLFHDFDEEEVESFFEEHDDEIRNEIYARGIRMTSPSGWKCFPTTTASTPTGGNRRTATVTKAPILGIW